MKSNLVNWGKKGEDASCCIIEIKFMLINVSLSGTSEQPTE